MAGALHISYMLPGTNLKVGDCNSFSQTGKLRNEEIK